MLKFYYKLQNNACALLPGGLKLIQANQTTNKNTKTKRRASLCTTTTTLLYTMTGAHYMCILSIVPVMALTVS